MLSLIIPHRPFPESDAALERCLESFKGHYDELILIVNENMGYGPAVNLGLKWATGDQIIVSNNDIILLKGELRNLPWTPSVTVPIVTPPAKDHNPRCIFGMPRWVYEELMTRDGYFYDPRFEIGYFEDDDLIRRLYEYEIPTILTTDILVENINGGGLTMKTVGEQKYYDINEKVFKDKWPDTYSSPFPYPS